MDEADFWEVWELTDEAELDMLEDIASAISDNARKDRAGWTVGLTALLMGIQRRGEKFARDLAPATYQGMYRGFLRSNLQSFDAVTPTESALEAAESLLSPFYDRAAQMATEQAFGASRALEGYFDRLTAGMRASASSAYIRELEIVSTRAQQIGYEDALAESVHRLAQQGITASTYVRQDGVVARVPVDVGLRRSILDEARNRQRAQILDIAAETTGLVEVSITPNARPSHAQWQGEVYTLDKEDDRYPYFNDACHVGDPVDGFGGYNCGHEVAAYLEGAERIFKDPLDGTGYTPEEATDAVTQQRALERQVRSAKREVEELQRQKLDTAQAKAKLAGAQQRLKEHVDANAAVLKREPWREGTSGLSYLSAAQREGISSSFTKAVYGALNNTNDPDWKKRDAHAERFYAAVRKRNTKREVSVIAKNTGLSEEMVKNVYNHVFINKHELDGGFKRFDPSYDMAESWRRLREGRFIQPHDIIMLLHEDKEAKLMAKGLSYDEAHAITERSYNYREALAEFLKQQS